MTHSRQSGVERSDRFPASRQPSVTAVNPTLSREPLQILSITRWLTAYVIVQW